MWFIFKILKYIGWYVCIQTPCKIHISTCLLYGLLISLGWMRIVLGFGLSMRFGYIWLKLSLTHNVRHSVKLRTSSIQKKSWGQELQITMVGKIRSNNQWQPSNTSPVKTPVAHIHPEKSKIFLYQSFVLKMLRSRS